MTSRRVATLFRRQFLSAFNDNFVRNMPAMLIPFGASGENPNILATAGRDRGPQLPQG
jgi:hypothetical protein